MTCSSQSVKPRWTLAVVTTFGVGSFSLEFLSFRLQPSIVLIVLSYILHVTASCAPPLTDVSNVCLSIFNSYFSQALSLVYLLPTPKISPSACSHPAMLGNNRILECTNQTYPSRADFPLLLFCGLFFPSAPFSYPFLPLSAKQWSPSPARRSEECCELPQWGPGRSPGHKSGLVYFDRGKKICLISTIFVVFVGTKLSIWSFWTKMGFSLDYVRGLTDTGGHM